MLDDDVVGDLLSGPGEGELVMKKARCLPIALVAVLAMVGAGCGEDDEADAAAAPLIKVTATDYAFDVPATISGGLVDMTLDNTGKEPHFAAFAQPAEGKSIEDVRASLTALASGQPPSGPPPFVEYMALGTVDPGGQSRLTGNLPAGKYILFCMLPSPDGVLHTAKGMMTEVEATGGSSGDLPKTDFTIPAFDFALGIAPPFEAGTNSVTLENRGKQIHEIDLVELAPGKTVEDMVAWAAKLEGPPPGRFLGGPAVRDGLSVTTTFEMRSGTRYALVCIVPDSLSDGKPHITKGMYTPEFQTK
jgi:hypothetical protein